MDPDDKTNAELYAIVDCKQIVSNFLRRTCNDHRSIKNYFFYGITEAESSDFVNVY